MRQCVLKVAASGCVARICELKAHGLEWPSFRLLTIHLFETAISFLLNRAETSRAIHTTKFLIAP